MFKRRNIIEEAISEIKEENIDCQKTKEYIKIIKSYFMKMHEICNDELSEEEIKKEFLAEYEGELKDDVNARSIFVQMLQYRAYKQLLANYKGNKAKFSKTIKEAKKREENDNKETIPTSRETDESMVSAIRSIIRYSPHIDEKSLISAIQSLKTNLAGKLKSNMIKSIHKRVSFLNEYGFIDKYIEESNEDLEKIGLSKLKFKKRNPLPDEQYDENGNIVDISEDNGFIDSLSEENLEELSPEELLILTTFWESKYLEQRIEMSSAMATINYLNLWDKFSSQDDNAIDNINEERVRSALKKEVALSYLQRKGIEITPKIEKQYQKFLKTYGLDNDLGIETEAKRMRPEIDNLVRSATDITLLQGLILYYLKAKEIKAKKWGAIDGFSGIDKNDDSIVVAMEHPGFRGVLLMESTKKHLEGFFETSQINFPKFNNPESIDKTYVNIMSKLYPISNKYFRDTVAQYYRQDPSNLLYATLAGKKHRPSSDGVKPVEGETR